MSARTPSRPAWQERADRLRAVPLTVVLDRSGAVLDRADPHKWHTAQGVLSVTGAQFMNWHRGRGGGGAIDLVMHLHGVGFGQALEWLEAHGATSPIPPGVSPQPRPPLRLPEPTPEHLAHVRRYLLEQRRLPPALLDPLIATGHLYADARANAVFLLRGPEGQPVGAELRGTGPVPWRGMAPGSRKDRGCFAVPTTPRAVSILCESAIDALSCHVLHPDARCLSTAGARPDPAWLANLLAQGGTVCCGFDLDPTGEAMAQAMIARHPLIQRLRPSRKDWNEVLRTGV
ncbi:MAG: toprim domain-containing protein [Verrucomicrobiales bacterium]|nr:toprim domain-containing protein [Verrucomicrobiales bacterium]